MVLVGLVAIESLQYVTPLNFLMTYSLWATPP
jgi:hypothetical protein